MPLFVPNEYLSLDASHDSIYPKSMMNTPPTSTTPTVNDDELLQVVTLAASQIPEQLKASTDRLKVLLDTHAGTYNVLHRIAADLSQPLQVRQQSIIQFKNAALSHWRSRKSVLPFTFATRAPLSTLSGFSAKMTAHKSVIVLSLSCLRQMKLLVPLQSFRVPLTSSCRSPNAMS